MSLEAGEGIRSPGVEVIGDCELGTDPVSSTRAASAPDTLQCPDTESLCLVLLCGLGPHSSHREAFRHHPGEQYLLLPGGHEVT